MLELNTFSVVTRCPRTGMLGVAISTAVPAVGSLSVFAEAGVGAVATQAWVNPYLGIDGLNHMRGGDNAEVALRRLIEIDPGAESRQLGMVDSHGRASAYTGKSCPDWCGHITGDGFAVQGNLLISGDTLAAMATSIELSVESTLPERLVSALEAGQKAGGDRRGRQSAALKVVNTEAYPYLDLRVDAHDDPVTELRRLYELSLRQLLPFIGGLPTRDNAIGRPLDNDVVEMLMKAPDKR